jgi:hypothetical protein
MQNTSPTAMCVYCKTFTYLRVNGIPMCIACSRASAASGSTRAERSPAKKLQDRPLIRSAAKIARAG